MNVFQCSATSMASLYVSSPREVTTSLTGHWTRTAHQARTLGQVKISPQQVSGLCWSFVNCSELSCILRCGVIALRFASFRRPLTCFPNIFDIFSKSQFPMNQDAVWSVLFLWQFRSKGLSPLRRRRQNKRLPVTKVSLLLFFSTARLRLKSIWNIMHFDRFCIAWTPSKIFKRCEKPC